MQFQVADAISGGTSLARLAQFSWSLFFNAIDVEAGVNAASINFTRDLWIV